jgi:Serine/threonine protein kinase
MAADDPWIGTTLDGRYQIAELIGRGGMAAVYRARDIQLNRPVAIKIFAAGAASDDARRRAEVQLLARLNHPNLVTLFDARLAPAGSATPSYLSMELVDGPDLRALMDRGVLPGSVTAQLASDVAEALVTVHGNGVVHRDLKPANILLAPTGLPSPEYRAKLADFGIAHLVGGERLTTVGLIVGTAAYLSPEQASGHEPGSATDVYTLGLVILECLTGARAYPGTLAEAISARLVHPPEIPATLPVSWASLIRGMTASDPAARPSAVEVAVAARRIAPDLDDWMPPAGVAGSTDAVEPGATVPLPAPTLLLPESVLPESALATSALATSAPTERLRAAPAADVRAADQGGSGRTRRRVALGAGIVVVLAAAIVAALLLQPARNPPGPAHTSTQTSTPSVSSTPTVSSPPTPTPPTPGPPGHGPGKGKDKGHKGK